MRNEEQTRGTSATRLDNDRQEPELPRLWLLSKGGKDLLSVLYHTPSGAAVRFPYDFHTLYSRCIPLESLTRLWGAFHLNTKHFAQILTE
jgi:hypothetical protein